METVTTVYLSLGSNIGNRAENLRTALAALPSLGIAVTQQSSLYETEPVDYLEQDWFLNCVVAGQTAIAPAELLRRLRALETKMGSKKQFAKGPRLIDLDILLYGNESIDQPELTVPHPRMLNRRFVMAPLAEIAPALRHPQWPGTATELLAATVDHSQIKISPGKL
jgi:2-amino-4-hydroxy-6-hydroxymethyldihydropteridine diphosphokinase